jgi:hypothetical protein
MKTVAAHESGATIGSAGRRSNQGIGFKAPGHQMPAVMPRPANGNIGAVFGPADMAAGESPSPIQMKTRIGPVDDPAEREADRIADAIVDGRPIGAIGGSRPDTVWRKCAACAAEEEQALRRKEAGSSATPAPGSLPAARAATAISSGGVPLPASERAFFEPRFGRDLSDVRLHADEAAASASSGINARAFTLGSDIGFARGEYAPGRREGRRLIAHELAHVVQRLPFIARQPAPFHTRRFQDQSGGGSTEFIETVQVAPVPGTGGYIGSVDRSVVIPASAGQPAVNIPPVGHVRNIRFDPGCFITVPLGIQFQQQAAAAAPICQQPPSATAVAPLPAAQFQALQTRYINALNAGLNGWYAVRVEGCNQPCAGKPIPIHIDAHAVANNPDTVVNVVNRAGRGDAATICAGSFDSGFAAHEGGHQTLGVGDEYQEQNPTILAAMPQWGRPERVRTDLTQMGAQYGRFSLYHERHFRFAQVFLEAVYRGQGCTVSLEELRGSPADFRVDVGEGGASTDRGGAFSATAFIGAGIPLERQRRLSLLLGGQGQLLKDLDRTALMIGVRAGFEAQTSPGKFGLTANIFAAGGASHQFASSPSLGQPGAGASTSPYGEVGAGVGIHTNLESGWLLRAGVEVAKGQEFSNDPNAMRWVRYGFTVGLSL